MAGISVKLPDMFGNERYRLAAVIIAVVIAVTLSALLLRDLLNTVRTGYVAYGDLHLTLRGTVGLRSSLERTGIVLSQSRVDGKLDEDALRTAYTGASTAYATLLRSQIVAATLEPSPALKSQWTALASMLEEIEPTAAHTGDPEWTSKALKRLQDSSSRVNMILDRVAAQANASWASQLPDVSRALRILAILCVAMGGSLIVGGFLFGYVYMRMRGRIEEADASLAASKAAIDEANKAIDAKNNFLAVIGHELRTPQQTQKTSLQFLELRLGSKMDAADRETWNHLKESTRQSEALMRDLTDFARLESGKMSLVNTVFNPADVLKRLISNLQHAARKKGLHIVGDFKNTRTSVQADETRFAQVANNLIINAIKYSDSGTILVKLYYISGEQTIMRLSVEDNGPGIREEYRAHLFEPFSQDDQSRTRKHDGAGMGLAIVSRLVKLMGGRIQVSNNPTGGARFTVKMPVDIVLDHTKVAEEIPLDIPTTTLGASPIAITPDPVPEVPVETQKVLGKRILLVDDKEDVRKSIKNILQHFGYQVDVASDGQTALQLAADIPFNAIILDIQMPGMDGFEVAEKIKETPGPNFDVPLIAVSGFEESIAKVSQTEIFTEYLMKPIGYETLVSILEQLT